MPNNPVSLKTVLAVAAARAGFADWRTGRDCRPTNNTLAQITGFSVRTVRRASTALRLLGVATEVLRGRLRTRDERFASWRLGDRGRGWASVWALHDSRFVVVSSHPEGSPVKEKTPVKNQLTTRPAGAIRRPPGDPPPLHHHHPERPAEAAGDPMGLCLARRWRADRQTPAWARRHTAHGWASSLASLQAAGWDARDVNAMICDWGLSRWIPSQPYRPIGLLRTMITDHGDLTMRPADAERARDAEELAARDQRIAAWRAREAENAKARENGRRALGGRAHAEAMAIAAQAARRADARRRHQRLGEAAEQSAAAESARTPRGGNGPRRP